MAKSPKNEITLPEKKILGAMIKYPDEISKIALVLNENDFSSDAGARLFKTIMDMYMNNCSINVVTVSEELGKQPDKDKNKISAALMKLMTLFGDENIESIAGVVKNDAARRKINAIAQEVSELSSESSGAAPVDTASVAAEKLAAIVRGTSDKRSYSLKEAFDLMFDRLKKLNGPDREQFLGLPTGFNVLDSMLGGICSSDLVFIGARPAMGKTALALCIAMNMIRLRGAKVMFFSLEMSAEQIAQRIMSIKTYIAGQKLRSGNVSSADWYEMNSAYSFYKDYPLIIDDTPAVTPAYIKARVQNEGNVDVIFIDYLSLMKSTEKTENRVQDVSQISRDLKLIAKELSVPVIALCQLNRQTDSRSNKSHRPQLADLRESGSIEQDADQVMMIYRESYYDPTAEKKPVDGLEAHTAEILVEKNRHGETGTAELAFFPQCTLFVDFEENRKKEEEAHFD